MRHKNYYIHASRKLLILSILIWLLIPQVKVFAQNDSLTGILKKYAYPFQINNGLMNGPGADYLFRQIDSSQFLLLGENHQSSQLAKLNSMLIPLLDEKGFKNMAIEVGPFSATVLQQMGRKSDAEASLKYFNRRYYNGSYPIPFFTGKEDARYLSKALEKKWVLWGLDQEYNNSNEFLFDELLKFAEGKSEYDSIKKLKETAYSKLVLLKKTSVKPECSFLDDTDIEGFLRIISENSSIAGEMVAAIRKSWEIYCLYADKKYKENNTQRAEYMKANFMKNYNLVKGNGQSQPKVFIKLGHGHVTKGKSPLGVDDIGMMVRQLAETNRSLSLHIAQRQRYVKSKLGIRMDYIKYSREIAAILKLADKKKWVVIDLRAFKKNNPHIVLSKEIQKEIDRYDILLLTPIDKAVKKIANGNFSLDSNNHCLL